MQRQIAIFYALVSVLVSMAQSPRERPRYSVSLSCMDTILIDNKTYSLVADPFYVFNVSRFAVLNSLYPEINDIGFNYIIPPQSNRFYLATWEIRGNCLFLHKVEPDKRYILFDSSVAKAGVSEKEFWAKILPPTDSVTKRIERLTGQKFTEGLIQATWFSGTITAEADFVSYTNSREGRFGLSFLNRVDIEVKDGIVVDVVKYELQTPRKYDDVDQLSLLIESLIPLDIWQKLEYVSQSDKLYVDFVFNKHGKPSARTIIFKSYTNSDVNAIATLDSLLTDIVCCRIPMEQMSPKVYLFDKSEGDSPYNRFRGGMIIDIKRKKISM